MPCTVDDRSRIPAARMTALTRRWIGTRGIANNPTIGFTLVHRPAWSGPPPDPRMIRDRPSPRHLQRSRAVVDHRGPPVGGVPGDRQRDLLAGAQERDPARPAQLGL